MLFLKLDSCARTDGLLIAGVSTPQVASDPWAVGLHPAIAKPSQSSEYSTDSAMAVYPSTT
jgi:hypothetical protein